MSTNTPDRLWLRMKGRTDIRKTMVTFEVEGWPPFDMGAGYSTANRTIFIETVDLTFTNGLIDTVDVVGRRKLKSGAMGSILVSRRIYNPLQKSPKWLLPYLELTKIEEISQVP